MKTGAPITPETTKALAVDLTTMAAVLVVVTVGAKLAVVVTVRAEATGASKACFECEGPRKNVVARVVQIQTRLT